MNQATNIQNFKIYDNIIFLKMRLNIDQFQDVLLIKDQQK